MRHMKQLMDKIDLAISEGNDAIKKLIADLDIRGRYMLKAKLTREGKMTSDILDVLEQGV